MNVSFYACARTCVLVCLSVHLSIRPRATYACLSAIVMSMWRSGNNFGVWSLVFALLETGLLVHLSPVYLSLVALGITDAHTALVFLQILGTQTPILTVIH